MPSIFLTAWPNESAPYLRLPKEWVALLRPFVCVCFLHMLETKDARVLCTLWNTMNILTSVHAGVSVTPPPPPNKSTNPLLPRLSNFRNKSRLISRPSRSFVVIEAEGFAWCQSRQLSSQIAGLAVSSFGSLQTRNYDKDLGVGRPFGRLFQEAEMRVQGLWEGEGEEAVIKRSQGHC